MAVSLQPSVGPVTRERALQGAAIAGVGVSVPDTVVPSAQIAERLGVSEDWIIRRTGIRSRHLARPEERLSTHAANAARRALQNADIPPRELDLVVVATVTADELLPNAAPLVARELGANMAGAFDVGAACSGFLSALAVACGQVEAGRARCVAVIGGDLMSRITDPGDRGTAAVFADGAGAVVVTACAAPGRVGPTILHADRAGADPTLV